MSEVRDQPNQYGRNAVCTKNTKISQAWWQALVIPTTQEAEVEESLEPRRQRLQWAKMMPLHSSLSDRVSLCLKKNKRGKDITLYVVSDHTIPLHKQTISGGRYKKEVTLITRTRQITCLLLVKNEKKIFCHLPFFFWTTTGRWPYTFRVLNFVIYFLFRNNKFKREIKSTESKTFITQTLKDRIKIIPCTKLR